MEAIQKDNRKVLNAWCLYDWANSSYSLVITSAIFPAYFLAIALNGKGESRIPFLFWNSIDSSVLYAYSYSFSSLIILIVNPLLGSLADYAGLRKLFMKFFSYIGSIGCMLLYFSNSGNVGFTITLFIISSISYSVGVVFYNSFLPVIASVGNINKLSARGFAWGYIGGTLMLLLNLAIIKNPQFFGFSTVQAESNMPIRLGFVLVGLWWLLFAQIAFMGLPKDKGRISEGSRKLLDGYKSLLKAFEHIKSIPLITIFLASFFFYNMGVQTVMGLASLYAKTEIGMETPQLILTILILQLLAVIGSYAFLFLSKRIGDIKTLLVGVLWWIGICVYAYSVKNASQFYVLAVFVGLIMGGIQSLSRSTFAKFISSKTGESTSLFSFYDVLDKIGIVLGTFLFGLSTSLAGSMRYSILIVSSFFIIALFILLTLNGKLKQNELELGT